ncbi:S-adenosyl-L-methionine-dependent methyltransferase [Xylariaceae sp. FL1651]|nr:S-adenosyl-L-methionine-dependent methyltransferase [Xylariaceae sp. FL1651]
MPMTYFDAARSSKFFSAFKFWTFSSTGGKASATQKSACVTSRLRKIMADNEDLEVGVAPVSSTKGEWDEEELPIEEESAVIESRLRDMPKHFNHVPVGVDDEIDEQEIEEELLPDLADIIDIIDLTDDKPSVQRNSQSLSSVRNPPIRPPDELLDKYVSSDAILKPGSVVEIPQQLHLFKASFLLIEHIIQTPNNVRLRGIPLTRMRHLRGRLPRLRNEIAMILGVDEDDSRNEEVQAAIEVPVSDITKTRNCHFTNANFPQFRTVLGVYRSINEVEQNGVLMCRWKCIFVFKNSLTRTTTGVPFEYVIQHLDAKQVKKLRFRVSDTHRLNTWRGGKVRGGEHDPREHRINGPVVQLDGHEDPELILIPKKPGQRYTFGDMFCGAGGASCGARKAGFQVKVSCDNHVGACKTYEQVFPESTLYRMDVFDFITGVDHSGLRVDILHLSPPCQFWSPAHTVAGVNDEANIAVLFSCHELIKILRPRLFTLEQTFGILHPKFEYYFNALVHGFTQHSYSIRWKVVDLVDWGSPARRRRLIMIGSCPGENLPPIPEATHVEPRSIKSGKSPYVTVRDMLDKIPPDASVYDDMHQPQKMVRKYYERWDPSVTLKRTITTNGGVGNYHPDGNRDFSMREYATLQTFPVKYPFQNPDRKRQIGNAFPPLVVKTLYTHLRKWLENKDRVYTVEAEPADPKDPDYVVLDSEDDMGEYVSDNSEIEYMGLQRISGSSGSSGKDSSPDEMDIDMSDNDYSPVPCIDGNQRRRVWSPIDLTGGSVSHIGNYIDLTDEH